MAFSSALARHVVAFSAAAPSSILPHHALRVSEEVVTAIRGHLAAAARRAALHAAAAPEVTGLPLFLPPPLESDLTATRLDSTSSSSSAASAASTVPGGKDTATRVASTCTSSSAASASWTVPGGEDTATRLASTSTSSSATSASLTVPGGEDFATSSTPASSSSFLLVLYTAEWARGVFGKNSRLTPLEALLIPPGTSSSTTANLFLTNSVYSATVSPLVASGSYSSISRAPDAPSGLLLLVDRPTRLARYGVKQVLLRTDVSSTAIFFPSGPNTRRFFSSASCTPSKGPPPAPALRDVRFLIALMDGMVLTPEDLMYLRQVVYEKLAQDNCTYSMKDARLKSLEDKIDLLLERVEAGHQLILKTLLQKLELGTIKIFGRQLDLTKIASFLRAVVMFITTGSI